MTDETPSLEPKNFRETRETAEERAALAREVRERRLRVRCWRRGVREMDLILGGFVDAEATTLSENELDAFEALIREDDAALYRWIADATPAPAHHHDILARIRRFVADQGAAWPIEETPQPDASSA